MKILALDPATVCGWATADDCGTWNLKTLKDESMGMKLVRFRAKLREIYELEGFEVLAYERPAGRHAGAVIHQSKLVAVIEEFATDNNIEYKGYSSTQIKKHATGKGNCNKKAMIQAAADEFGYEGKDDNEADALWLYDLVCYELGLE